MRSFEGSRIEMVAGLDLCLKDPAICISEIKNPRLEQLLIF